MTLRKVLILDDALEDLDLGRLFYDLQEEGVGAYFVDSLLSDIHSLSIFSGIHPVYFGFHRMLSKRFPFAIYYNPLEEVSHVIAVLDMRKSPQSIKEILENRGRLNAN